jgi:hypothetical protein
MNAGDVGKIALVGVVAWLVGKKVFGAETSDFKSETTAYQPPAYPDMVVDSLLMRPAINEQLNTQFGSAPSPSVSNFVDMIRGVPV